MIIVRPETIPRRDLLEEPFLSEFGGFRPAVTVEDGEESEENFCAFRVFRLEVIMKDILHVTPVALVTARGKSEMCL